MLLSASSNPKAVIINFFGTIVVIFVSVAAIIYSAQLVGPLPLSVTQTTTQKAGSFDVTGTSEVVSSPDQAELSLGVTSRKSTVAQAQDETNTIINGISTQLKSAGIDAADIKTSNYAVYPEYDYSSGSQRIVGYSVNATLLVLVKDLDKVNQVIDVATGQGANQVGGITFGMSEELETKLKAQAREEAIAKAKDNAQELARLAGMKLGKIINVYESRLDDGPVPLYARELKADAAMGAGGEPTQVEPGSTTYEYQVTLSYETL